MKKIVVAVALILVFITTGSTLAEAASDKGIVKSFSEDELRELWKLFEKFSEEKLQNEIKEVSTTLDKIEGLQDDGDNEWKGLIMDVYKNALKLYKREPGMPETSLLVARSFYYNERLSRAKTLLRKVFYYDGGLVGAYILDLDIKLLESKPNSSDQRTDFTSDDGVDFLYGS